MNDNETDRGFDEEAGLELEKSDRPDEEPDVGIDRSYIASADDNSGQASSPSGFPTRSFNAGDVIFKEGDPGNEAYLILNGQVKITRKYKKKRILLNQLGKEQIFGEMAIITGEPRTATAEAMEPTEVYIITENKLNENLNQHLAIVKNLIDQLIGRLKQLLKQQSTALNKIEGSLGTDKKVKQLQAKAAEYEQSTSSREKDDDLQVLLQMIRDI